jgi:hypothetical protein
MKKTVPFLTVLVLTLSVLAGCGCRNSRPAATTAPTTMPTTAPTTEATTIPTTLPTQPSTDATIEDGNGPLSTDSTTATDETVTGNARSGGMIGSNGMMDGAGTGTGITGSFTG